MTVSDILNEKGRDVITVLDSIRVEDAVRVMDEHRIGAVVVLSDAGAVRGILSERDVMHRIGRDGAAALWSRVSECMTERLVMCAPTDTIDGVMATMTQRRIRHLPVIEKDNLAGMVSIGDVVKRRIDQAEHDVADLMDYIAS